MLFQAQSSKLERLFSLKSGKRDVRALSFELSKMPPHVGLAVHTYLHVYIHTYMHVCVFHECFKDAPVLHTLICVCKYGHVFVVLVCVCVCVCVCMCVFLYVYKYVCVFVCVCVCVS